MSEYRAKHLTDDETAPRKEKLAILGGGVGAVTAAFALSEDGWQDRFESITIYQQGWRLGGKGASGRGPNDRIEEHGLHIWLGFYENSFRCLRECYEELGRAAGSPLATVDEAFARSSRIGVEDFHDAEWSHWVGDFPEDDRIPGVPDEHDRELDAWEYVVRTMRLMATAVHSLRQQPDDEKPMRLTPLRPTTAGSTPVLLSPTMPDDESSLERRTAAKTFDRIAGRLLDAAYTTLLAGLEVAEVVGSAVGASNSSRLAALAPHLDTFTNIIRRWVESLNDGDDERRRLWYVIELGTASIRGILAHGLVDHPDGFDAIDEYDYVDWLLVHGVSPEAAQSAVVRTLIYDLPFSYYSGDYDRPFAAAGAALRLVGRFFLDYKGAIMWKMCAGMGDTIFAPYYEVLKRRGVKFEFFQQVRALHLDASGESVESVTMRRQAVLASPDREYQPLRPVKGLPCWPSEPIADQLVTPVNADDLEWWFADAADAGGGGARSHGPTEVGDYELVRGEDFDTILFGISLGAVPHVAAELVERHAVWKEMVEGIPTCQTQAFQVWLKKSTEELGWPDGWATVGGYVEPFDTWGDMSHLIDSESFPEGRVGSIAYFCNVLPDDPDPTRRTQPGYLAEAREQVKANALEFLRHNVGQLWPTGVQRYPDDFDWSLLVQMDPAQEHVTGMARFDSQFWRANVDPSERYVMACPGNTKYRILPGETGLTNLVVAGDWTYTRINAGCVEAATISGLLASNALTGFPAVDDIRGFLAP